MVLNRILDASIVLSFDRNGFMRHARDFDARDLQKSLAGQHIMITGANSGIGYGAAATLVKMGAKLTMVSRNEERLQKAQKILKESMPEAQIATELADMSSVASVAALAERIQEPVSCLIHNAGAMLSKLEKSEEGHEMITATHVLGPFALTMLLRKRQMIVGDESNPGRVVFVSSGGMYSQALDLRALIEPPQPYDGMVHYAQTKRAQVVLAQLLDAHLKNENIRCLSMHPGWVDTPGVRRAMPKFYRATKKILRDLEGGSDTIVWLAAVDSKKLHQTDTFYFDRKIAPTHKLRKTRVKGDSPQALLEYVQKVTGHRL